MNLFEKTLGSIVQKAEIKKAGGYNGVPYPFPRFRQYIPSIDPEQVIGITSFSGAAKSKFLRSVFIMYPYEFAMLNNYNLEIDYYALEDSAEKVFKNILCHYLNRKCKEKVGLFDLDSKFKELPSHIVKLIKEGEKYLQDFSNKVRIKDTLTTASEIKRDIIKRANELGELETKEMKKSDGSTVKVAIGYKPRTQVHRILAFDNLNNVEKDMHQRDSKEAMDEFVKKDCRLFYSKILKATCVIIHQQALEAERQQFTNTGDSITEKVKPSMANLGGTKEVVRSYHLLFSLFNPHKFKAKTYKKYDISLLGNNFRELEVLKNNDGFDNVQTALYFDGAGEYFQELPHSEKQPEELQRFYEWLSQERLTNKNKSLLF